MKIASIIVLLVAVLDAGYLGVWAIGRSMDWSIIAANFESDAGKSTVGTWHLDHVRSVGNDYDRVLLHALVIVVLIVVAAVLFANRKATLPAH